jgi:hypothetical protein
MMANNRNGISEDKTQLSVPKSNLKIIDIKAKFTPLTHICMTAHSPGTPMK